jgi:hypothetical protein
VIITAIFQEYDCPVTLGDFDLNGANIVAHDEKFLCTGCGQEHTGGHDGPQQVHVLFEDDFMEHRELPKTQEEKAALIAQIGQDSTPQESHWHLDDEGNIVYTDECT